MDDNTPVMLDLGSAREVARAVQRSKGTPPRTIGSNERSNRNVWQPLWKVLVTAPETGRGAYQAKSILYEGVKPLASAAVTTATYGTLSETVDVLFINDEEANGAAPITHALTEGGQTPIAWGQFIDFTDENPPRMIIAGLSMKYGPCPT